MFYCSFKWLYKIVIDSKAKSLAQINIIQSQNDRMKIQVFYHTFWSLIVNVFSVYTFDGLYFR